ncbi:MAG: DivIVA domain-containing protein [Nitrospinaceae bacterium]
MRLNYLDILEQCFREKFRGYSKQEVDTFLQLVADDFKDMAEEIQQLKKEIEGKDTLLQDLKARLKENPNGGGPSQITPEILKEKAKRIILLAREQAEQQKKRADSELTLLKKEIQRLRQEKTNLIQTLKDTARQQLDRLKK